MTFIFVFVFACFVVNSLMVLGQSDYPLVLSEITSKSTEAKSQFCQQTRFTGVYSTGVYYKAVLREDDTSLLKLGKSVSRTRAFTFKFNPYSGNFYDHRVTLEGTDEKTYFDCEFNQIKCCTNTKPPFSTVVAFTGVHIDLFNQSTDLFVEMFRKVQQHFRENEFDFNQVAYSASRILASRHVALESNYAQRHFWNMCFMAAFIPIDRCFKVDSGRYVSNRLFPDSLVSLSSPEDHFALLFIKQENKLVHIRSEKIEGSSGQWSIRYSYVHLTNSHSDVSEKWKSASLTSPLDYNVIGAIEHYKKYYLVTITDKSELQLRKVIDYTTMPLQLDEAISLHSFFRCEYDLSEYYQTMVNAVLLIFCCTSLLICRKAADYQRQGKPLRKDGKVVMSRQMRQASGSRTGSIASQYLMSTGADRYYVDEGRMKKDQRRVLQSIANMTKGMVLLPQRTHKLEQLKAKILARKKALLTTERKK